MKKRRIYTSKPAGNIITRLIEIDPDDTPPECGLMILLDDKKVVIIACAYAWHSIVRDTHQWLLTVIPLPKPKKANKSAKAEADKLAKALSPDYSNLEHSHGEAKIDNSITITDYGFKLNREPKKES